MGETKRLYPNIRAELSRYGYTMSDLAKYMGITRQALYMKFNGSTQFNERDMRAIQDFFKVKGGGALTLDYLFKDIS